MSSGKREVYEQALRDLPRHSQLLMCCACVEHVLPLYEHFRKNDRPRDALDYAWECAFGRASSEDVRLLLDRRTSSVIPSIEEDESAEADLCMRSAIGVLETLDVLSGKEGAVVRACVSPFDALLAAASFLGEPIRTGGRLFDVIADEARVPRQVALEWRLQNEMIREAAGWPDGRFGLAWREQHRHRGKEVLEEFAAKLLRG